MNLSKLISLTDNPTCLIQTLSITIMETLSLLFELYSQFHPINDIFVIIRESKGYVLQFSKLQNE